MPLKTVKYELKDVKGIGEGTGCLVWGGVFAIVVGVVGYWYCGPQLKCVPNDGTSVEPIAGFAGLLCASVVTTGIHFILKWSNLSELKRKQKQDEEKHTYQLKKPNFDPKKTKQAKASQDATPVSHLAPEFQVLAENHMREIDSAYEELKNLGEVGSSLVPPVSGEETSDRSINSFFSFAGLTYGDTMADAHRILGRPVEIDDDLEVSFITQHYFSDQLDGLDVSFDRNRSRVVGFTLLSKGAVYKIRSKGIVDPNLSYLGQHWDVIRARFGNPTIIDKADNYGYEIYSSQEDAYSGLLVNFVCHEADELICSVIDIIWFYNNDSFVSYPLFIH